MLRAPTTPVDVEIRHAHLFCGLGGGASGFNRGAARVKNLRARFRCIGGIDHDAAALRDFARLAGVPGTLLNLFSREQYVAFYGREPPPGWREATPEDVRTAFGNEHPHIAFLSAPCKGFSGLLAEKQSRTAKYQALNGLALRGVWLLCEAYKDDPIELIIFENVPRIATRGRHLLDQIVAILRAYGYAVAETTHDCGELGNLAQSRKRFLLVARHQAKVPAFLYQPEKKPLRGVGEVLDRLPLPGLVDAAGVPIGGPMHRMPALQWKTWVRLAFVEAGSDWRSLNKLAVDGGVLRDFGIAPETGWYNGAFGVKGWDEPAGTVTTKFQPSSGATAVADPRVEQRARSDRLGVHGWDENTGVIGGEAYPSNGAYAVSDPRVDGHHKSVQLGVRRWQQSAPCVTSKMIAGGGPNSVADPRILDRTPFNHAYRIVQWGQANPAVSSARGAFAAVADPRPPHRDGYKVTKYRVTGFDEPSGAVIGASTTGNGAFAVADPRHHWHPGASSSKERVAGWDETGRTITGAQQVASGAMAVADPRHGLVRDKRAAYDNGGHYGVVEWTEPSGAVSAAAKHDNGRWSVADPRGAATGINPEDRALEGEAATGCAVPAPTLPGASDRLVCVIRALDGTWHRPITTLEMAVLQSLVDPEEFLELDGLSDSAWRERIGNAVPRDSAAAIARVMGQTLLLIWSGETFVLSSEPIWVQPIALALAVDTVAA